MRAEADRFRALGPEELADWTAGRAGEAGLSMDEPWLRVVIETLAGLQDHSRRVAAALDEAGSGEDHET